MPSPYRAEWEWGWNTPLLLRFRETPPPEVSDFLGTPLEGLTLERADRSFAGRVAELRTSRIGIRFERVQEALFRAHADTESLRPGLVVPGRTEIDLLHRLRSLPGTAIHWEVAVKFYLGLDDGGSADADRFIGPSLRDTLGLKSRAIFGRQLAVLDDPEVRLRHGDSFGISPDDRVIALPKVHGILFHPFRGRDEKVRPPEVAENGMRGAWVPHDQLDEFFESLSPEAGTRVRWLRDRQDWIRDQNRVPAQAENESELNSWLNSSLATRLQSHFASGGEPIQAVVLSPNPDDSELRFFVVPKDWRDAAERGLETLRGESRIKL